MGLHPRFEIDEERAMIVENEEPTTSQRLDTGDEIETLARNVAADGPVTPSQAIDRVVEGRHTSVTSSNAGCSNGREPTTGWSPGDRLILSDTSNATVR